MLTGNHEQNLRDYAFGQPVRSKEFLNKTAVQFAEAGIDTSALRQFYRKLGVAAYITYRGNDFIISHGGIPYLPNKSIDFYSADNFIRGVGNYEDDIDEIFDNWAQKENEIRKQAIEDALAEKNLVLSDTIVGDFGYYTAREETRKWIKKNKKLPDAFVCANDVLAMSVCVELEKNGYNVI